MRRETERRYTNFFVNKGKGESDKRNIDKGDVMKGWKRSFAQLNLNNISVTILYHVLSLVMYSLYLQKLGCRSLLAYLC